MKSGFVGRSSDQASPPTTIGQRRRKQRGRSRPDPMRVLETACAYYPRLTTVSEYVKTHVTERLTLAEMAHVAGLERKYFSAYFHAKTGVTWTEWLRLLRISRAQELVQARDFPICRLAFASGFGDVRTFERAFKRVVGVPPVVYRAAVRPESRPMTGAGYHREDLYLTGLESRQMSQMTRQPPRRPPED